MTEQVNTHRPGRDRHRLTPEDAKSIRETWAGAPEIQSFLPLQFEGGSEMDSFTGECSCCGVPIEPKDLRGTVTRPTRKTAMLEAWGLCRSCKTWVSFSYTVKSNPLRLEWRDESSNEWFVAVGRQEHGPIRKALTWVWRAISFQG